MKLNIGSGRDYRSEYINIDAVATVKPDLVLDLLQTWPFENNSVSEVLAHDILEHFTREQLQQHILPEITRVLKTGGVFRFRTPNPDAIIKTFAHDPEVRIDFLYGAPRDTGIFGAHKVGFTQTSLVTLLYQHQLWIEDLQEVDTNFVGICHRYGMPQITKQPVVATSFSEYLLTSWLKEAVVWVVNPAVLEQELKKPFKKFVFKLIRSTPTLVIAQNNNDREALTQFHISLAKIRLLSEQSLSEVLREAQLRHFVQNSIK